MGQAASLSGQAGSLSHGERGERPCPPLDSCTQILTVIAEDSRGPVRFGSILSLGEAAVSSALFCGHCQQAIPVADDGSNPARCPRCQAELAPAGADAAWWLSSGAPHPQPLSPEGREELPPGQPSSQGNGVEMTKAPVLVPEPAGLAPVPPGPRLQAPAPAPILRPAGSATDVGPWGGLAVALGLLSFGISWLPRLAIFGIALGCLGLLLALIGLLVLLLRREQGSAFPLTAAVVCLQALVLASVFTLRQDHPANQASDDGTPKPGEKAVKPPAHQDRAVKEVLDALKSPDLDKRRDALQTLGNLAGSVVETVPALAEALTDADPRMRLVAARALGEIGPRARRLPRLAAQQHEGAGPRHQARRGGSAEANRAAVVGRRARADRRPAI